MDKIANKIANMAIGVGYKDEMHAIYKEAETSAAQDYVYEKIANMAISMGYEDEMEAITKESAAAAKAGKPISEIVKGLWASTKKNVGTFWGDPGAAFRPQTFKGLNSTGQYKEGLKAIGKMESGDARTEASKAFLRMLNADKSHNNAALKGLGITAGGVAAAGAGISALTPAQKVRVVN